MSLGIKLQATRESYIEFANQDSFLRKIIVYMVNHRVQDFSDPLTNTLVLMATSPMQLVCCESGIIPFKTSLLPVIPYALLSRDENEFIQNIILQFSDDMMHETMESSGQYTLSVFHSLSNIVHICRRQLLLNFVYVMINNNSAHCDNAVSRTLCNIILQRFMARVSVPSEMISTVIQSISAPIPPEDELPISEMEIETLPILPLVSDICQTATSTSSTIKNDGRRVKQKRK
jgi:hypothetical protein